MYCTKCGRHMSPHYSDFQYTINGIVHTNPEDCY